MFFRNDFSFVYSGVLYFVLKRLKEIYKGHCAGTCHIYVKLEAFVVGGQCEFTKHFNPLVHE